MASIIQQMDAADHQPEESGVRQPRRGEIVEGTIASVDVDAKSEGAVPLHEIMELLNDEHPPKVGDQVLAYVLSPGDREGRILLSLRQGMVERAWRQLEQLFESGQLLEAPVTEANKGGV